MQRKQRTDLGQSGGYTCNDNKVRDTKLPNTLHNKDDIIMISLYGGQLANETIEHL